MFLLLLTRGRGAGAGFKTGAEAAGREGDKDVCFSWAT